MVDYLIEYALFDQAVENGRTLGRPFTEEEVFRFIWEQGYELMPEMDPRFICVDEGTATSPMLYVIDDDEESVVGKQIYRFLCELHWHAERCRIAAREKARGYSSHWDFFPHDWQRFGDHYLELLAIDGFTEARP